MVERRTGDLSGSIGDGQAAKTIQHWGARTLNLWQVRHLKHERHKAHISKGYGVPSGAQCFQVAVRLNLELPLQITRKVRGRILGRLDRGELPQARKQRTVFARWANQQSLSAWIE